MKNALRPTLSVLRKREEFLSIANQGRKWVATGLILQVGASSGGEFSLRYGLTASGRIGNAVIRNRARRRLRALAAEILLHHALQGRDYVLIARATTAQRDFTDLRQDLTLALRKLDVWRDKTL